MRDVIGQRGSIKTRARTRVPPSTRRVATPSTTTHITTDAAAIAHRFARAPAKMFAPPVPVFAPVATPRFPLGPSSGNASRRFMSARQPSDAKKPAVFSFEPPPPPPSRRFTEPRVARPPPRNPNADDRRLHRRGVFLGNVRSRQDDARWESRGDQILQLDLARRQREWEAEMARSAPALREEPDREGDRAASTADVTSMDGNVERSTQEEREIDELLDAEEAELEARVQLHERERERAAHSSSPVYAEDDEFEEALWGLGEPGEAMDTS